MPKPAEWINGILNSVTLILLISQSTIQPQNANQRKKVFNTIEFHSAVCKSTMLFCCCNLQNIRLKNCSKSDFWASFSLGYSVWKHIAIIIKKRLSIMIVNSGLDNKSLCIQKYKFCLQKKSHHLQHWRTYVLKVPLVQYTINEFLKDCLCISATITVTTWN